MTDRLTASTINDAQLDQLYRERDEARQHAAAIAAQRDRLRQRMNNLADRWDNALAPDKPYARTLRAEISVAPFDPDGAMTVQEYTERGQHLWAFRCWGTETCDGWLGLGHHTQTSALLERERHVAEAHGESGPAATEATEATEGAEDLTGYTAPDPPIGCITATAERAPAWTPPPPGSTAEQLPDDLLALIRGGLPDYTSTACVTADALAVAVHWSHPRLEELREHAERLHNRCRLNQKFTGQLCACGCH